MVTTARGSTWVSTADSASSLSLNWFPCSSISMIYLPQSGVRKAAKDEGGVMLI